MEFTLYYNGGLLKSTNTNAKEKQELRRHFHLQLKLLWTQPPLANVRQLLNRPETQRSSIIQDKGGFQFAPLVNKKKFAPTAELNITLLRPGPPGEAIRSGDIDNRLKTLLDALKMPNQPDDIPQGDIPKEGETPFFVLLEDDSLITNISINTYQWLEEDRWKQAILILHVKTELALSYFG